MGRVKDASSKSRKGCEKKFFRCDAEFLLDDEKNIFAKLKKTLDDDYLISYI